MAWQTQVALLVGFGIAAYFKVDSQLFFAYVLGITGGGLSFMWGNAQEHKAKNGLKTPA